MRKNHAVDMGSGAVFSTLLRLGTPALISMFFETLNGLVDSLFVARLGTIPLAAMALALFAEAIFFSYGDTRTPMLAMIAGNLCNIVLDPLLIFGCGLGVEGASLASLPGWLLSGFILRYFLIVFFMACPIVCRADREGIAPAGARIQDPSRGGYYCRNRNNCRSLASNPSSPAPVVLDSNVTKKTALLRSLHYSTTRV